MLIYRFNVYFTDDDDFLRTIEIKSNQTFLDLHKILVSSIGLDEHELASFFICDQEWNKLREITLIDMNENSENQEEKPLGNISEMSSTKLNEMIDDPHQQILYEYDFLNQHIFLLELTKIQSFKADETYPRCTLKNGTFIRQTQPHEIPASADGFKEELQDEYDDMVSEEFDGEGFEKI